MIRDKFNRYNKNMFYCLWCGQFTDGGEIEQHDSDCKYYITEHTDIEHLETGLTLEKKWSDE